GEGHDRARQACGPCCSERRHLRHRARGDQGRASADDDRGRPRDPPAQSLMAYRLAAGALALGVLLPRLRCGAMGAGGADSYGYLSQAESGGRLSLIARQPIVRSSPWPDAAETWAPLGYRPSPHERDAIVPIYPPGLPLLMAAAQAVAGFCGAF